MDEAIRDLERRASADPSLLPELREAWVRSGRGWDGEDLPPQVVASGKPGIYLLNASVPGCRLELVHVKAGLADQDDLGVFEPTEVGEFWIGRFPVTWREWLAYCRHAGVRGHAGRMPEFLRRPAADEAWTEEGGNVVRARDLHPVVHVSLEEAAEFCSTFLCSLPTSDEWSRAAGRCPEHRLQCRTCGGSGVVSRHGLRPDGIAVTLRCDGNGCRGGMAARSHPWGSWRDDLSGRALIQCPDDYGTAPVIRPWPSVAMSGAGQPGSFFLEPSGTVLREARPCGVSPWGCQDMIGNVWEMLADGSSAGGCWRSHKPNVTTRRGEDGFERGGGTTRPDTGFRVVARRPVAPR